MSNIDFYKSTPLSGDPKAIRVLRLEPSQQLEDPLRGTLQVVSLSCLVKGQLPVYSALSYVWGDFALYRDFLCCGSAQLPISRNCRDGLRRLRSLYGGLTIWVDAICIDQSNVREKIQQVKLMGQVYTWADVVYIWLGPGTKSISRIIDLIKTAAKKNYLPLTRIRAGQMRRRPTLFDKATVIAILDLLYASWLGFKSTPLSFPGGFEDFLGQEWFLRAWTFQEALLSSHSVVVTQSETLGWDTLVQGIAALHYLSRAKRDHIYGNGDIYHYNIYGRDSHRQAHDISKLKFRKMPPAFYSLHRLTMSWMRMTRPTLVKPGQESQLLPCTQSAHESQKSYAKLFHTRLLRFPETFLLLLFLIFLAMLPVLWILRDLGINDDGWFILVLMAIEVPSVVFAMFYSMSVDSSLEFAEYLYEETYDTDHIRDFILEEIFSSLRERKAKLPHDRSYALYGILQRVGLQLAEPDYNKSPGRVYYELMLDLLRWSPKALILLIDAGVDSKHESQLGGVPSWVPNWNNIPPKPTISADYFLHASNRTLDATPNSRPQCEFDTSYSKLTIRGIWKGRVSHCTLGFSPLDPSLATAEHVSALEPVLPSLDILVELVTTIRSTPRAVTPLAATSHLETPPVAAEPGYVPQIQVNTTFVRERDSRDAVDLYFVFNQSFVLDGGGLQLEKMKKLIRILAGEESWGPIRLQSVRKAEDVAYTLFQDKETLAYFLELVNDFARNDRRFFLTSDNFLGCGSKEVARDDRVFLAAGIPAPLVLRRGGSKHENEYRLVCSAYVLGWMHGDAYSPKTHEKVTLV
jgi:hypothetical protein